MCVRAPNGIIFANGLYQVETQNVFDMPINSNKYVLYGCLCTHTHSMVRRVIGINRWHVISRGRTGESVMASCILRIKYDREFINIMTI